MFALGEESLQSPGDCTSDSQIWVSSTEASSSVRASACRGTEEGVGTSVGKACMGSLEESHSSCSHICTFVNSDRVNLGTSLVSARDT